MAIVGQEGAREQLEVRHKAEEQALEERTKHLSQVVANAGKGKKAKADVEAAERKVVQWAYELRVRHQEELEALEEREQFGADGVEDSNPASDAVKAPRRITEAEATASSRADKDAERVARKKEKTRKKKQRSGLVRSAALDTSDSMGIAAPSLEGVAAALLAIEFPDKKHVWNHFLRLAKQQEKKLPPYRFIPRGGLSSPYVHYVTDVDLIFNNPQKGSVTTASFDELLKIARQLCGARNIYAARLCIGEEELFDEEVEDMEMTPVRVLVEDGADVVTLTGWCALPSGWCVPVDFTLQRGESRMPKSRRIDRIIGNLKDHNFAKVVSRVRAILSPASKAKFADSWNGSGSALRFLAKQLDLAVRMPPTQRHKYMASFLRLPGDAAVEDWASIVEVEMQRKALDLLKSSKSMIAGALGDRAGEVFAALDVAGEAAATLQQ